MAEEIIPFTFEVYPESPVPPYVNGPVGSIFTFSQSDMSLDLEYTAGGISVPNLVADSLTISGTVPGYQPINVTITLGFGAPTDSYTAQLTQAQDSGTTQAKSPKSPSPITTNVNTLPTITSPTNPEFASPNTSQGSYFTMTQARLYIGRLFIDELNAIQFTLQNNKIPIYGYASRDYDAIAQGKSLVQGQFTINFISEGYLYVALQEYINTVGVDGTPQSNQDSNQAQLNSLITQLQYPDPQWTPEIIATAAGNIQNLITNMGPNSLTLANAAAASARKAASNNILGLAGGDYPNAVYQDTGFDIVLQFQGAGRTVTRRIESCRLISNESILDHSGTPILDSYGFIGRRLR